MMSRSEGKDISIETTNRRRLIQFGEPAPWFKLPTLSVEQFSFHTLAGRIVILDFLGGMSKPELSKHLEQIKSAIEQLGQLGVVYFAVTGRRGEHADLYAQAALESHLFLDEEEEVAKLYGVPASYPNGVTIVLDERLRVLGSVTGRLFRTVDWQANVASLIDASHVTSRASGTGLPAPVLIVPRIFERSLCERLISFYHEGKAIASGFMRDIDGRTTLVHDPAHKIRKDRILDEATLRSQCLSRIRERLVPEIRKAFQFNATRIERYLVARYSASESGHFRPHRDNTTIRTAHRKFAVSINLNCGAYEGGKLRFPEFGDDLYEAPTGGAVVFSCSLLHEATRVTVGNRYAFLPFLYDESAAQLRHENFGAVSSRQPDRNDGTQ